MMGELKRWLFLLVLAGLVGCTPQAENVVKKQNLTGLSGGNAEYAQFRSSLTQDSESLVDDATRIIISSYETTIKKHAEEYGFDWRLILAVMKQESSFMEEAKSVKGATGLMQIMPTTSREVAHLLEIKDMAKPRNNIRGGIFYLRRLYAMFDGCEESDRIKLALAAYNAGLARLYDAQEMAAYMHDNPGTWRSIKDALPLLSKRYYTLHRNIWVGEKPRNGWFGSARETIGYVENIMDYYDEYRLILN